ncbi:MAG: DUF362 domain-containing protein, partial [Phycisphaerae bacterium]|nr:DUF362 domain-containing protein [Phycisphaerae bacterium]
MCPTKKDGSPRRSGSDLISALKKRPWAIMLFPIIGLAALIWFLIRVVPKPSRAEYPCQRVAAPLASSFVVWLLGVVGSTVILHRAKRALHKSRVAVAWTAVAAGVFVMFLTVSVLLQGPTEAAEIHDPSFEYPDNEPIGVGRGIFPGRVAWVRDVTAVNWDGWEAGGFWSGYVLGGPHINRVDQAKVDVMIQNAVMWLSGENTPAAAWDALFKYRNGGAGYTPGEKFAIKLNHVTTNGNWAAVYDCVDIFGEQIESIEYVANSREMVLALLKQLVNVVGVPQTDIYIGDPLCYFPNMEFDYMRATFPNIHYMTKWPLPNRQLWTQGSTQEIFWSYSDGAGGYGHQPDGTTREHDYLPEEYVNAAYLINFAVLKSHNPGITLCGKNHYGSLWRRPAEGIYYDMHTNLAHAKQDSGLYREIVDLMGHEGIGGKTLLFLVDGLWAGYKQQNTNPPEKYRSVPFNGEWPALLLASQDPVAIDSVGFDILWNEGTASWDYP